MRMNLSMKTMLNNIVPVSRFNRGEASKIFDEVVASGTKIVLKNNTPTCVLVSPEEYDEMMEQLEDYTLLKEAAARMDKSDGKVYSEKEVLAALNILEDELSDTEAPLE